MGLGRVQRVRHRQIGGTGKQTRNAGNDHTDQHCERHTGISFMLPLKLLDMDHGILPFSRKCQQLHYTVLSSPRNPPGGIFPGRIILNLHRLPVYLNRESSNVSFFTNLMARIHTPMPFYRHLYQPDSKIVNCSTNYKHTNHAAKSMQDQPV